MNSTLNNVIFLSIGAAIGVAASWHFFKTKYQTLAEEEIESVREMYRNRPKSNDISDEELTDENEPAVEVEEKELSVKEYAEVLSKTGYTNYTNMDNKGDDMNNPDIAVITPEEFADTDEDIYEIVSLTYYADNFLTDDADQLVEDVDKLIGRGSLTRFGEYEDDAIYVRNEKLKCVYEILRDSRNYVDIRKNSIPPRMEG